MRRSFVVCLFTIVGVVLGIGSAHAQLRVQVTNAPPNEAVEVRLSGEAVADMGTATSSAGGDLSMLLNAGSLGKAQPAQITVYIEDCEDGAKVHLVAAGGVTPEDCDEDPAQGDCNCRRGGIFLLQADTTWISVDFSTGAVSAGSDDSMMFPIPTQEELDQLADDLNPQFLWPMWMDWRFKGAGSYGRLTKMMPVSGQGVIKQGDGPESRMTETPDSFDIFGFEAGVRFGVFSVGYEGMWGDAKSSESAEPGRNGELFLGKDAMGFNGRFFTGFATEEEISTEFRNHEVQITGNYQLPKDANIGVFLRVQAGSQDYTSSWRATDFPDFGSVIDQEIAWLVAGGGVEVTTPALFTIGTGADFRLQLDGMIGYGNYDYEAAQTVSSPPAPPRLFAVEDHESRAAYGFDAEATFRARLSDSAVLDLFTGVSVFTLPTINQVTGDQLEQGLQNELEFVSPRKYFLGARLRF